MDLQPRFRPTVKREKADKKGGWNKSEPTKPKEVKSRINTGVTKLKLLDATRKAIMEKSKKQLTSSYCQTDTFKTKLCRDVETDTDDMLTTVDQASETDVELVAYKAKDGTCKTCTFRLNFELSIRLFSDHNNDLRRQHG